MNNSKFKVEFYDKEDGRSPAREFLDGLDAKMFAKMVRAIDVLKAGGTMVREPYSKHLDDGIFEVRAQISSNISRVLFFFYVDRCIVLTHGFIKKTQKTPPSEIKLAKKYRAEFINRKGNKQ